MLSANRYFQWFPILKSSPIGHFNIIKYNPAYKEHSLSEFDKTSMWEDLERLSSACKVNTTSKAASPIAGFGVAMILTRDEEPSITR